MSLKTSATIRINTARIDEATAVLQQAKNRRLPEASISGAYLRLPQPNVTIRLGDSTGEGRKSDVKVNQAAYGIANVSLPLFAGGAIKHGIESAKYLAEAVKLDAQKDHDKILLNTLEAYSNLYKAQEAIILVRENLRSQQQRVKDFQNLETNGLLARNDFLKAQLQASNIELSVLDAESNYKVAEVNMNLMLGLPENTALVVDSSMAPMQANLGNVADWENLAFQNRKEFASLNFRTKSAASYVKVEKAAYYPSLALTGGYVAAYVPNVISVFNAINGGVGLNYSISSLWKASANVNEAKAKLQQVELQKGMLGDMVRLEVNNSYEQFLLANKKTTVYALAVEQAEENYRILKNKYDNSLATATDLLDADVAQLQAKLNSAYGRADADISYYKLLLTTGTLSQQFPELK